MKFDIKKKDCKLCPKCGKHELHWHVIFAEEICYSAECPECGLFFANELNGYRVEDEEG